MENITAKISQEMKDAMRSKEKERLMVIRLIQAAFKQREVDDKVIVDDQLALEILDKMLKQRKESAQQYKSADRNDLAEKEEAEIVIIQSFMPAPLKEKEIDQFIDEAISQTGAQSIRDMGKVMGLLKPKMQGRADMGKVSGAIKSRLAGLNN